MAITILVLAFASTIDAKEGGYVLNIMKAVAILTRES